MQVMLCNREHPEYGVATIPLPIPDEEYAHCMGLLEALEIGDVTAHDCYLDQIIDAPPILDMLEKTMVNIDELDFLARSMDRFTNEELAKFQCMTVTRDYKDVMTLINLSFCCETTTVITDFSDLEAVGKRHYMNINGGGVPSDVYRQLNGEGIARELIAGGEGIVTPYGVIYENAMRLEPLYGGNSFPPYADQAYLMEFEIDSPRDGGVVIFLPQPEKRLERLIERAGIRNLEDLKISSWHSDLPDAIYTCLDVQQEGIFELNRLCSAVHGMDEAQREKLSAVILYAEPEYAMQIRHLAENLDQFDFIPGATDLGDYGRHMIKESGHYEYDDNLDWYYDYEQYAKDHLKGESYKFCDGGLVIYRGTLSLDELMMEEPAEQEQMMGGIEC